MYRQEKNDEYDPNDGDSFEYINYEGDGFWEASMEFDSYEDAKEYLDTHLVRWFDVEML